MDDIRGGLESLPERGSLHLELIQPFSHLARRQGPIRDKVEQALFLHVEGRQLLLDPRMRLAHRAELLVEVGRHVLPHRGDRLGSQLQPLHLPLERLLNEGDWQVRQIACPILPTGTQVILVGIAMRIRHLGVDQLPIAALGVTASAAQHGPQEVVVDDVPLVALLPHIEDALHPLEDLWGHQGLVLARIDLALVGHHAQVVGIAEEEAELAARDGLLLPLRGAPSREALLGQFLLQPRQAVVPRGVLVEGPGHEWSPLRIDGDPVDEVAVDLFADVEITDSGATGGAAVHGLVEHLGADVLAALADLDLVHDIGDGLHRVGHVPLAEFLLGGDQLDVHAGQDALGDGGIGLVPEDAGAHVDDDVAHLRMLLDVVEELAEHGPFGDRLGGVPRLDELLGDRRLQALRPLARRLALGGDGVAIGVEVDRRAQLALGGDPQIEHGRARAWVALRARCLRGFELQQALETRYRAAALDPLHLWRSWC